MTLSIGRLSAALGIEPTTLRHWAAVAEPIHELGYRDGGRRLYEFESAYVLGVLSGISHCGVRVSPSIISDVLAHVVKDGQITEPAPGETFEVRESGSAVLTLHLDKASELIIQKLGATDEEWVAA